MKLIIQKNLNDEDKIQILRIWKNEYPKSLNYSNVSEFDNYLVNLSEPEHYIVKDENSIFAWACKFSRENEKWFLIILDEKIQNIGKGTEILNALKSEEKILNAWVNDKENCLKLNGEIYKSPMKFYLKNGFDVCPEIRIDNDKISAVKIIWRTSDFASH